MFSGSVDAGFVLALLLHHGDLEPDCVGASTRGAYVRDENTSARLCAKNAGGGGLCARGAYLRDTTVNLYARVLYLCWLITCCFHVCQHQIFRASAEDIPGSCKH